MGGWLPESSVPQHSKFGSRPGAVCGDQTTHSSEFRPEVGVIIPQYCGDCRCGERSGVTDTLRLAASGPAWTLNARHDITFRHLPLTTSAILNVCMRTKSLRADSDPQYPGSKHVADILSNPSDFRMYQLHATFLPHYVVSSPHRRRQKLFGFSGIFGDFIRFYSNFRRFSATYIGRRVYGDQNPGFRSSAGHFRPKVLRVYTPKSDRTSKPVNGGPSAPHKLFSRPACPYEPPRPRCVSILPALCFCNAQTSSASSATSSRSWHARKRSLRLTQRTLSVSRSEHASHAQRAQCVFLHFSIAARIL